jgi:hypothetical protein
MVTKDNWCIVILSLKVAILSHVYQVYHITAWSWLANRLILTSPASPASSLEAPGGASGTGQWPWGFKSFHHS